MDVLVNIGAFIQTWNECKGDDGSNGVINHPPFIDMFVEMLEEYSTPEQFNLGIEYLGGEDWIKRFAIAIKDNLFNAHIPEKYGFEVSYSKNGINVYTNKHCGFYTKPYIAMYCTHPDFPRVYNTWLNFLRKNFNL